jgi:VanZ family protein
MLAYGIAIELIQSFEPTRDAELKDVLVDVVGIALGLALYRGVVSRLFARTPTLQRDQITSPSR